MNPELQQRLEKLEAKYAATGQDWLSYLDGLIYSDYLSYWDYIHLDVLLNLQQPKTKIPDENIFIIYHQITELYFKLVRLELQQIIDMGTAPSAEWFDIRIRRCVRYFEALTKSFAIMSDGMDKNQFLQFRMALLPASGFQSAQYRKIEMDTTSFQNLVDKNERHRFSSESTISEMYPFIYWKFGATDRETGKKTYTLIQFEEKYSEELMILAEKRVNNNVWSVFESLKPEEKTESIKKSMRLFDLQVNALWPMAHFGTAVRYLKAEPEEIAATGGTNWMEYLPPQLQKRIFFPTLWEEAEKENWGKTTQA